MDNKDFLVDESKLDSLTGIFQREVIFNFVEDMINKNQPFYYGILDIDNFKNINDSYGHRAGDTVLKEVASQLKEVISPDGIIGRFGGDEFIFAFIGEYSYDDLWQLCFKMLRSPRPIPVDNYTINVTYTMGIAGYPKDASTVEELFDLVDKALYRGKTKGRDCFIIYVEEKHKNIFLKSIRERNHSQMYLHNRLQTMLFKDKNYSENIQKTIDYVASYLMLDMMYIQRGDRIESLYVTPLSEVRIALPIEEDIIQSFIRNGSTYLAENSIVRSQNRDTELYRRLNENGIFSTVMVELKAFDKFYGYLRADMIIRGSNRVWQQNELTLLIELAQKISLLKYIEAL